MVDHCFSVAVFCICSALTAVILRQYSHEQSMLAGLAACTSVVCSAVLLIAPVTEGINDMFLAAGLNTSYINLLFKAAAVSVITEVTCEMCRDCGENAIASAAEVFGRSILTIMALPLVRSLMEMITALL